MKGLVWTSVKKMEVQSVPEPTLRPSWVILRVSSAGICGSDVGGFLGKNELRKPPLIMGHEFSGVVEEIGTGIPKDLKDKLVTANPFVSCGSCAFCRRGERQLCSERKIIGVDFPGAFAERIAVPYKSCYPITDPIRGALVEPLACAVRAIEKLGPTVGDSAVVFGAGTLGLMVTKLLDAAGVRELTVVDINATRLQWAKAWGATSTLNPNLQNIVESVKGQTIGGVDCIVDAVGSSETRRQSVECVRRE
jgi:threonine dehydrogenase-like Zn-dependent dehydrogenase